MAGHCRAISSASCGVSVMTLPAPKLMPPLEAAPDRTMSVFAPMLAMLFCMAAFDPWPISIMAMTAPTAMITPRALRADRILFRRKASMAVMNVRGKSDARVRSGGAHGTQRARPAGGQARGNLGCRPRLPVPAAGAGETPAPQPTGAAAVGRAPSAVPTPAIAAAGRSCVRRQPRARPSPSPSPSPLIRSFRHGEWSFPICPSRI